MEENNEKGESVLIRIDYLYGILANFNYISKIKYERINMLKSSSEKNPCKDHQPESNKIFEFMERLNDENLNLFKKEKNIFNIESNNPEADFQSDYFYYISNEPISQLDINKRQTTFYNFFQKFFENFKFKILEFIKYEENYINHTQAKEEEINNLSANKKICKNSLNVNYHNNKNMNDYTSCGNKSLNKFLLYVYNNEKENDHTTNLNFENFLNIQNNIKDNKSVYYNYENFRAFAKNIYLKLENKTQLKDFFFIFINDDVLDNRYNIKNNNPNYNKQAEDSDLNTKRGIKSSDINEDFLRFLKEFWSVISIIFSIEENKIKALGKSGYNNNCYQNCSATNKKSRISSKNINFPRNSGIENTSAILSSNEKAKLSSERNLSIEANYKFFEEYKNYFYYFNNLNNCTSNIMNNSISSNSNNINKNNFATKQNCNNGHYYRNNQNIGNNNSKYLQNNSHSYNNCITDFNLENSFIKYLIMLTISELDERIFLCFYNIGRRNFLFQNFEMHKAIYENNIMKIDKISKNESNEHLHVNINEPDPLGNSPLLLAIKLNKLDAIKVLCDNNAEIKHFAYNEAITPYDYCIANKKREILKVLINSLKKQKLTYWHQSQKDLLGVFRSIPDFSMSLSVSLNSNIFFVIKSITPKDTFTISKKGSNIRIDMNISSLNTALKAFKGKNSFIIREMENQEKISITKIDFQKKISFDYIDSITEIKDDDLKVEELINTGWKSKKLNNINLKIQPQNKKKTEKILGYDSSNLVTKGIIIWLKRKLNKKSIEQNYEKEKLFYSRLKTFDDYSQAKNEDYIGQGYRKEAEYLLNKLNKIEGFFRLEGNDSKSLIASKCFYYLNNSYGNFGSNPNRDSFSVNNTSNDVLLFSFERKDNNYLSIKSNKEPKNNIKNNYINANNEEKKDDTENFLIRLVLYYSINPVIYKNIFNCDLQDQHLNIQSCDNNANPNYMQSNVKNNHLVINNSNNNEKQKNFNEGRLSNNNFSGNNIFNKVNNNNQNNYLSTNNNVNNNSNKKNLKLKTQLNYNDKNINLDSYKSPKSNSNYYLNSNQFTNNPLLKKYLKFENINNNFFQANSANPQARDIINNTAKTNQMLLNNTSNNSSFIQYLNSLQETNLIERKISQKEISLNLFNSQDFPIKIYHFIPLIHILSFTSSEFSVLNSILCSNFLDSFPLKISFPLGLSLYACLAITDFKSDIIQDISISDFQKEKENKDISSYGNFSTALDDKYAKDFYDRYYQEKNFGNFSEFSEDNESFNNKNNFKKNYSELFRDDDLEDLNKNNNQNINKNNNLKDTDDPFNIINKNKYLLTELKEEDEKNQRNNLSRAEEQDYPHNKTDINEIKFHRENSSFIINEKELVKKNYLKQFEYVPANEITNKERKTTEQSLSKRNSSIKDCEYKNKRLCGLHNNENISVQNKNSNENKPITSNQMNLNLSAKRIIPKYKAETFQGVKKLSKHNSNKNLEKGTNKNFNNNLNDNKNPNNINDIVNEISEISDFEKTLEENTNLNISKYTTNIKYNKPPEFRQRIKNFLKISDNNTNLSKEGFHQRRKTENIIRENSLEDNKIIRAHYNSIVINNTPNFPYFNNNQFGIFRDNPISRNNNDPNLLLPKNSSLMSNKETEKIYSNFSLNTNIENNDKIITNSNFKDLFVNVNLINNQGSHRDSDSNNKNNEDKLMSNQDHSTQYKYLNNNKIFDTNPSAYDQLYQNSITMQNNQLQKNNVSNKNNIYRNKDENYNNNCNSNINNSNYAAEAELANFYIPTYTNEGNEINDVDNSSIGDKEKSFMQTNAIKNKTKNKNDKLYNNMNNDIDTISSVNYKNIITENNLISNNNFSNFNNLLGDINTNANSTRRNQNSFRHINNVDDNNFFDQISLNINNENNSIKKEHFNISLRNNLSIKNKIEKMSNENLKHNTLNNSNSNSNQNNPYSSGNYNNNNNKPPLNPDMSSRQIKKYTDKKPQKKPGEEFSNNYVINNNSKNVFASSTKIMREKIINTNMNNDKVTLTNQNINDYHNDIDENIILKKNNFNTLDHNNYEIPSSNRNISNCVYDDSKNNNFSTSNNLEDEELSFEKSVNSRINNLKTLPVKFIKFNSIKVSSKGNSMIKQDNEKINNNKEYSITGYNNYNAIRRSNKKLQQIKINGNVINP